MRFCNFGVPVVIVVIPQSTNASKSLVSVLQSVLQITAERTIYSKCFSLTKFLNLVKSPLKNNIGTDLMFPIIQLVDRTISFINDKKMRLWSKEFDIDVTDNIPFDTIKMQLIKELQVRLMGPSAEYNAELSKLNANSDLNSPDAQNDSESILPENNLAHETLVQITNNIERNKNTIVQLHETIKTLKEQIAYISARQEILVKIPNEVVENEDGLNKLRLEIEDLKKVNTVEMHETLRTLKGSVREK